jgi:hypothetical protein
MRLFDPSLPVDEKRDPLRVLVPRRPGGPVRQADGPIGVGDQRKRKLLLLRECAARVGCVEADADDLRIPLLEPGVEVAEPATLGRSPRGFGLGKEPEDDVSPAEIAEAERSAEMVDRVEVGGGLTGLRHASHFPDCRKGEADDSLKRHEGVSHGMAGD